MKFIKLREEKPKKEGLYICKVPNFCVEEYVVAQWILDKLAGVCIFHLSEYGNITSYVESWSPFNGEK